MAKFGTYKVDLKGISGTEQSYAYLLGNEFFADIDSDEVRKGRIQVSLTVRRMGDAFDMAFHLQGAVRVPCDRCLDEVELPVDSRNRLVVKFGKEFSEESDEVVVVPEEEGAINVAWFLYEFVTLSLPMKHVHAPGKCNRDMASHLRHHAADDETDMADVFDAEAMDMENEGERE
ncbi:MAG: DUF177 domain-containing protein [Tannerellaceae bacterium]|jgi:uncharacterized metal-binding protein YceD (DUF177 family)|nr:DUF177 domain-containing protein [Tannerellaceae bacterium]